ncbi:MAG: YncE family protein, partial [Acidobacteriaceae bacterium]
MNLSVRMVGALLATALVSAAACRAQSNDAPPPGRLITNHAVEVNPVTRKVYAVNEGAGTVSVIDERTGATKSVKVGDGPIALAVNAKTNRIYVVNTDSGTISVIDGADDAVIATVRGGSHPYTIALDEVTNQIYATNTYSDFVTVIDGATNSAQPLK